MINEKLTFLLTNDDRPLREQAPKGSLLEEQYRYALRQINEYFVELNLGYPQDRLGHETSERKFAEDEMTHPDTDYNNNIFAFVGDRGSGKTSCMISVSDFLTNKNNEIDWNLYPGLRKINFKTIDLIDPLYFDETHNLISLFLAKLYKNFRKQTEENERLSRTGYDKIEYSEKVRNKFISKFQITQEHLYHLLGYIKYTDGKDLLEYVDALSASVNLKEDIKELVDIYMNYLEQKNTVLILRIDDVDINERHAGQMVETIRKYFIQPNILVLISFKLQQLENIKYLELKQFYDRDPKSFSSDMLRDMADKYMVKLIPHSHRIFMPLAENYHSKRLEVKFSNKSDETGETVSPRPLLFASVRQAIPQLIFWKTRYLFYNSNAHESYIVPTNLRELRQFIKLMVTLPNYRVFGKNETGEEYLKETNWNNKVIFKNYFFETWVNNHLPADLKEEANRILNEGSYANLNSLVYDLLDARYDITAGSIKSKISSPSFADVLSVIHKLEKRLTSLADIRYLFFIKSLYSMNFYEAYDLMTEEGYRHIQHNDEIFIDDDTKHAVYTPYQMLVGNSMFHFNDYAYNGSYSLDYDRLNSFVNSCLEKYKGLPNAKNKRKANLRDLEIRIKWIELIMLCLDVFGKETFDVGMIFRRLPYMYNGINRQFFFFDHGEEFLRTVINSKKRDYNTLGDDFRDATIKYRLNGDANKYTEHCWLSFCTIRNVEVLEGFLSTVKSGNYSIYNRYENLRTFFTKACEFNVLSYGRDEYGRGPYSIHFRFLEKILDLIKETDKPANVGIKKEITAILGDVSDNSSEVEENESTGKVNSTSSAV